MGIKQLYKDNLRKLPNEYGDVCVMNNKRARLDCFLISEELFSDIDEVNILPV